MPSYNRVILAGNLTRDPEQRFLPSNMPVTSFGLAVNDRWKDKQTGEWRDRANFIDCDAFGRTAEVINEHFRKGGAILVEGKLRMDQWQGSDGSSRTKLKVVVDSFEFLGEKASAQRSQRSTRQGQTPLEQSARETFPDATPVAGDEEIPF